MDDCGNKCVWKKGPHEKVGVIAEKANKPCIVEYSEITSDMAELTDADGRLVFGAGNICNHFYTLDFLGYFIPATTFSWICYTLLSFISV